MLHLLIYQKWLKPSDRHHDSPSREVGSPIVRPSHPKPLVQLHVRPEIKVSPPATQSFKPGEWVGVWGVASPVPAIEQENSLPEQQLVAVVALPSLPPTPLHPSIVYDWCFGVLPGDAVKVTIGFSFWFLDWFELGPSFAAV